ncbi:hypothetical protein E2562_031910 [Oryza meyeriana var. granulata]|uniref:Uncharacterized protein n=1 Tax=Oryza meyeriana var. granulata TaxID=110450 RepID=A0A6G1BPM8_9ORYZ|nr:hypothetical protein E2562_031910 [Oryza meyeriana var. granulata]
MLHNNSNGRRRKKRMQCASRLVAVESTAAAADEQRQLVSGEMEGGGREKEASSSPAGLSDSGSLSFSLAEKRADELQRKWATIERLPTADRLHMSLFSARSVVPDGGDGGGGDSNGDVNEGAGAASAFEVVNVRTLGAAERRAVVQRLVADVKHDHIRMLRKQRERMDR